MTDREAEAVAEAVVEAVAVAVAVLYVAVRGVGLVLVVLRLLDPVPLEPIQRYWVQICIRTLHTPLYPIPCIPFPFSPLSSHSKRLPNIRRFRSHS